MQSLVVSMIEEVGRKSLLTWLKYAPSSVVTRKGLEIRVLGICKMGQDLVIIFQIIYEFCARLQNEENVTEDTISPAGCYAVKSSRCSFKCDEG